nr:uncharacterized protein LOC116776462 [Danaus plexippus plexippus]
MENLCSVGPGVSVAGEGVDLVTCNLDEMMSPAQAILDLKEQICVTLEGGAPCLQVLRSCTLACDPNNVFCRAPTLTAILHLSVDFCVVYVSRHASKVLNILPEFKALWEQCCPHRRREEREEDDSRERGEEIYTLYKLQNILENLSTCMRKVSSKWPSTGKFTLFLDFLADFCNDMDYDLIE